MSTITVPGPIVRDVAEAAYFLLVQSTNPICDLSERIDSELHPEWWEDPFREFDAMRALIDELQPVERTRRTQVDLDDVHMPALSRALVEAIHVDANVLATGIKDGVDEYWVRERTAQLENLKAFNDTYFNGRPVA